MLGTTDPTWEPTHQHVLTFPFVHVHETLKAFQQAVTRDQFWLNYARRQVTVCRS